MHFTFDLHIHSCLSPCGDLACSPAAIVAAAKAAGLNALMIADHNTSRNCPALAEVCRRDGSVSPLFGMEITTAEELHALAVFDTLPQAAALTQILYAALPARENRPDVFGDQPVVNADEEILEMEPRLLSAPTRLTLPEIEREVHTRGGLLVACHIDRPAFSVISQLGAITGREGFDAVELSRYARKADWLGRIQGLPVLRDSDAHYLNAIGTLYNEADMPAFTVAHLKRALLEGRVKNL